MDGLDPQLAPIWNRHLPSTRASVDMVEKALLDWANEDLRKEAKVHAHRLAGSVGSFGFPEAGRICRELEKKLLEPTPEGVPELVAALRQALPLEDPAERIQPRAGSTHPALVVDDDSEWVKTVAESASTRSLEMVGASSTAEALEKLKAGRFDLIILELELDHGLEFLQEVSSQYPQIPILVVSNSGDLLDRVQVARYGGRGFLQKPIPLAMLLDEAASQLDRLEQQRFHVLLVDDDPRVIDLLRECLDPAEVKLTGTRSGQEMWEVLEARHTDLLILDLKLPDISGLDLLRALRNEQRFVNLPVLVLTANNDRESLEEAFAAGADDFVSKPPLYSELRARVHNRLERSRLLRELAEKDPLTGLTNRRRASVLIAQLLQLATRQGQPFCISLLDLDRFKQVNDTHGHVVGDQVLHRLGEELRISFRSEDILVRWGGEEFLLAMYGVGLSDAVFRLAEFLESFREKTLYEGQRGQITFSGGVAEYKVHGETMEQLYQAADEALYRAKAAGRDRIFSAGEQPRIWVENLTDAMSARLRTRGFVLAKSASEADLAIHEEADLNEIRRRDPRRALGLKV